MVMGLMRVRLHIPFSHSLKDKRSVLKRLIHALRTKHNCAVGEIEDQDLWQSSVLAIVTVYAAREQVESLFVSLQKELARGEEYELLATDVEYL